MLTGIRQLSVAVLLICPAGLLAQAHAKRTETATGAVTGTVTCADTNAPARFAVVTLQRVPGGRTAERAADPENANMNATATTDIDGRFLIEKVPVGRYFVVGILSGYMGALSRFDPDDLKKVDEATQKELLKAVPTVRVEANQVAETSIRLEHASELGGTVLYDDGSPAIHLRARLLRKGKDGRLKSMDGILIPGFGSEIETDDRGHYRLIGVPPGEYSISVSIQMQKTAIGGLLGSEGLSINVWGDRGGEVKVYSGSKFRLQDAKITKVGEGEQLGGIDITIPLAQLHSVRGSVTAKRDGHALNKGNVELLYADDRGEAQHAELDSDGNFELPYVPEDRYILRLRGAEDVELIPRHMFNSNFMDEKTLKTYGETELPLTVQGDMTSLVLLAPEVEAAKAIGQP